MIGQTYFAFGGLSNLVNMICLCCLVQFMFTLLFHL